MLTPHDFLPRSHDLCHSLADWLTGQECMEHHQSIYAFLIEPLIFVSSWNFPIRQQSHVLTLEWDFCQETQCIALHLWIFHISSNRALQNFPSACLDAGLHPATLEEYFWHFRWFFLNWNDIVLATTPALPSMILKPVSGLMGHENGPNTWKRQVFSHDSEICVRSNRPCGSP